MATKKAPRRGGTRSLSKAKIRAAQANWTLATSLVEEMRTAARQAVDLRGADLDAFDEKLAKLEETGSAAAAQTLERLIERREILESEIDSLRKHGENFEKLYDAVLSLHRYAESQEDLLVEAMREIDSTLAELKQAKKERDQAQRNLVSAEKKRADFEGEVRALREELQEKTFALDELQQVVDVLSDAGGKSRPPSRPVDRPATIPRPATIDIPKSEIPAEIQVELPEEPEAVEVPAGVDVIESASDDEERSVSDMHIEVVVPLPGTQSGEEEEPDPGTRETEDLPANHRTDDSDGFSGEGLLAALESSSISPEELPLPDKQDPPPPPPEKAPDDEAVLPPPSDGRKRPSASTVSLPTEVQDVIDAFSFIDPPEPGEAPITGAAEHAEDATPDPDPEQLLVLDDDDVICSKSGLLEHPLGGPEDIKLAGLILHQDYAIFELAQLSGLPAQVIRAKIRELLKADVIEVKQP